jgi:hypothetical protein
MGALCTSSRQTCADQQSADQNNFSARICVPLTEYDPLDLLESEAEKMGNLVDFATKMHHCSAGLSHDYPVVFWWPSQLGSYNNGIRQTAYRPKPIK